MKKILYPMVFFLLLAVSSCQKNIMMIGILIYDETDTFIGELTSLLVAEMPSNVEYRIEAAGNSQFEQNNQLLKFLDEGIDILLINAVDRMASSTIVEKSQKQNIPVIFFNREPLESDLKDHPDVYYVGADADSLGVKQAELAGNLFGPSNDLMDRYDKNQDNKIQTVILKGKQGHQDAEKRTHNCIDRLQGLGYNVDLLTTQVANWRRSEGAKRTAEIYQEFGDQIELIFANNDDMALGAIDFFFDQGIFTVKENKTFDQPIVIIGVDGTAVGKEAIEQGLMYASVLNDAKKQSEAILELVHYIVNKMDMEEFPYLIQNEHYIYIDGETMLKISENE